MDTCILLVHRLFSGILKLQLSHGASSERFCSRKDEELSNRVKNSLSSLNRVFSSELKVESLQKLTCISLVQFTNAFAVGFCSFGLYFEFLWVEASFDCKCHKPLINSK